MAKGRKKKYSNAEKRAYHMGYGVGLKAAGRYNPLFSEDRKIGRSYINGFRAGLEDTVQQTNKRLTSRKKKVSK